MLTFNQFKNQLEAECIKVFAAGYKINNGRRDWQTACCCPLGSKFANLGQLNHWPLASDASGIWGISFHEAYAFICGYSGEANHMYSNGDYYELGLAYHRKFINANI